MDIQSLKYILELNECGNFTEAAERCNISQSAFSKQIRNIESEIGNITIFDRNKRPVVPTQAGKEFMRYANQIVKNYDAMLKTMKKYNDKENNTLRIGYIPVIGRINIMNMLVAFHKKCGGVKNVNFELVDRPSSEVLEKVKDGSLDVGIIAIDPFFHDPDILVFPIQENKMVLIVDHMHRLAGRKSVDLKEVKNDTFIIPDERTGMFRVCIDAASEAGFEIKHIVTCRTIDIMMAMVSVGNGIGMASRKLIDSYGKNNIFNVIEINDNISYSVAIIVKNTGNKKLSDDLVKYALEYHYE